MMTLETLQQEYCAGKKYRFLFFWGHSPQPDGIIGSGCLSQWWMRPFSINDITYSCAEQYMMAEKARLFDDRVMLSKIMAARNPADMKRYGRSVKNFSGPVWDEQCVQIVRTANKAKFGQNPDLFSFLSGTYGKIIAEASPHDRIWGIGMGKDHPDAGNPMKWRGTNLLGFALTDVRDELMKEMNKIKEGEDV